MSQYPTVRYILRTKVRINTLVAAWNNWQFYNDEDLTTLLPRWSPTEKSTLKFTSIHNSGRTYTNSDLKWNVVDADTLESDGYFAFIQNDLLEMELKDYAGRTWLVEGELKHQWTAEIQGAYSYTQRVVIEEDDEGNEYEVTIKTYTLTNPAVFDVKPDYPVPDTVQFADYELGVNFDSLPNDPSHETAWKVAYNGNGTQWIYDHTLGLEWENVTDTSLNYDDWDLHPGIDLYWVVVPMNEDNLSAQEVVARSALLPDGYRSRNNWLANGGSYGGQEDQGYFYLSLPHAYCPEGVYQNGFKGEGWLYMVMAMTGEDLYHTPVKYHIKRETVQWSGDLAASVSVIRATEVDFQLSGFLEQKPDSPVQIDYCLNGGDYTALGNEWTQQVTVPGLTPNTLYDIGIRMLYMGNTEESETSELPAYTMPQVDSVVFSLTPALVDNELEYELSVDVTPGGNTANLQYAIFREEAGVTSRDYTSLDLLTLNIPAGYRTGDGGGYFQAGNTAAFSHLPENEIEEYTWVCLIENTDDPSSGLGNRAWVTIKPDAYTISGTNGLASPGDDSGTEITIPKESSNRYVKGLSLDRVLPGLLQFKQNTSHIRTYQAGSNLQSISLETHDVIPAVYSGGREDYLTYYLVLDGKRYPITPTNVEGQYPKIYHINLNVSEELRSYRRRMKEEFIDTTGPLFYFQVEAQLRGESGQAHFTPVIYSWRVRAVTDDSGISSSLGGGLAFITETTSNSTSNQQNTSGE